MSTSESAGQQELPCLEVPQPIPRVDSGRFRFLVELLERKSPGLARSTIASFTESARQHLATARGTQDDQEVRRALHGMKGAASTFGATRLVELLIAAETEPAARGAEALDTIESELNETLEVFDQLLPALINDPTS